MRLADRRGKAMPWARVLDLSLDEKRSIENTLQEWGAFSELREEAKEKG